MNRSSGRRGNLAEPSQKDQRPCFLVFMFLILINYIKSKPVFSAKRCLTCEIWFQNLFWKKLCELILRGEKKTPRKRRKPWQQTVSKSANTSSYSDSRRVVSSVAEKKINISLWCSLKEIWRNFLHRAATAHFSFEGCWGAECSSLQRNKVAYSSVWRLRCISGTDYCSRHLHYCALSSFCAHVWGLFLQCMNMWTVVVGQAKILTY